MRASQAWTDLACAKSTTELAAAIESYGAVVLGARAALADRARGTWLGASSAPFVVRDAERWNAWWSAHSSARETGASSVAWLRDPSRDPLGAELFGALRATMLAAAPLAGAGKWTDLVCMWSEHIEPDERTDAEVLRFARVAGASAERLALAADLEERRETERALREQDRYRTDFLATLAHELRNPLAPMKGAVQLLAAGVPEEQARLLIDILQNQVRQLVRLADDLSDVSRAYQGKLRLQREVIDLRSVLATAIETSQPTIQAGAHAFQWHAPPEPLLVEADGPRLVQLVANLLNNAAKYTPSGGNLALETEVSDGAVAVAVKDDGIGLSPAELEHVFELYEQVERGRDMAQGGLGIGLSLARAIAELHGGSLTGASAGPGRGSTFTLRLKLLGAPSEVERAGRGAAFEPLAAHDILVVDDSPAGATMMRLCLERLGQRAAVAGSAEEALALLAAARFDVVFSDIEMPGLGGLALPREVHRIPHRGVAPILIALSGREDVAAAGRVAGFDASLRKPVDIADLRSLLIELEPELARRAGS